MCSTQQNSQEKEVYFIILTPNEEKVNLDLKFASKNAPQNILKKNKEKGDSLEYNVFKSNIKKHKKKEKDKEEEEEEKREKEEKDENKYKIEYIVGNDSYDILFSVNENNFIYNAELKKGNKYLDNIVKEDINQKIPLYNKLDIFIEALKQNGE